MKKNKMMRTASVLLVLTLLTVCVISGTFAKYTTTASGEDTARVAKFGVTITENGSTFAKTYKKDNTTAKIDAESVISSDNSKVVAPGTKGNLVNSTITGTPEVAVNVAYTPTLTFEGWKLADDSEYCPIVFTVGNETYGLTGMKDSTGAVVKNGYATVAELKAGVENAIKAYSKDYEPKTDLSTIGTAGYVHVSWNWAFENNDANDTYLGNQAAAGNASTVKLAITTTVTQID